MQLIKDANAVAVMPPKGQTGTLGFAQKGDVALGTPATIWTAEIANTFLEEFRYLVEFGGGLTLDENDDHQIYQAILNMITGIVGAIQSVPVGTVSYLAHNNNPAGYLRCDGAAVSRITYSALFSEIGIIYGAGNGSTTFNLPDLRGSFIRGIDNTGSGPKGFDTGRVLGSYQADEFKAHTHSYNTRLGYQPQSGSATPCWWFDQTTQTGATGGAETRPKNVALVPVIKF